jgi:glycosyltransferase 2 family protein
MNRLKTIWSHTWRILICIILLVWIFHSIFQNEGKYAAQQAGLKWENLSRAEQWHKAWTVGPHELWHTLTLIHPIALGASLLCIGAVIILNVVRWRMVLKVQGLDLSFARATGISFVAQFFNSFLLGSSGGDLIKAYYAARETHHKKTEAVTTVVVDRLIGLWSMLLYAAMMMIVNLGIVLKYKRYWALCLLILAMFAMLSVVLGIAFWGGVSKRWPRARHYLRRLPKGEMLERSLDSCREFGKKPRLLLETVGLSLVLNTLCVLQVLFLAKGLAMNIGIALFVVVPVVFCISALPVTPSGLGVRENLFVLLLAVLDVPQTAALSLSLLAFAGGLFWSLVGGVVYMGLKQKEHLGEVAHPQPVTENV